MDGSGASRRRLVLAGVLLAVGILVHDLLRPLGVAGGVPYIAVVLVSWWMPQQRAAIILGIGCTMLTIVGFALSPKIGPMWELVTSRMLAIFAIWMVTMLCLQHKRAEVALRESEELFSLFMRHLPGLATMKDENHRISYLNETFEETFGISRNEWIGKTVDEVFPPETASRLRENDQWVLSNGRALKVTEDMQQADGVHHYLTYRFPIRRPGRPTVLGGVSVDLTEQIRAEQALQRAHNELERKVEERTADLVAINVQLQEEVAERKRTEEALRASEQLHTKAQQIAHLGHWERNFATDQDTWSRESYCIFGVDDDGGEGDSRGLLAQVHPDDAPLVESAIAAARDDGSPMDMDYRIIRPDRTERFVHTLAEVRRDERGQATSLVGTVQDITERKKAEKRIQRQQDELAHLSRLSTLGEMGTGLAHELNQPLASIVSYTQGCIRRIRDGKTEQSDLIAALASVTSEAERAGEIIRRIRRFIRKREPQQTRVEPAELIEQCLALVRHELQAEGVALDVQVGKDLPCIDADRIQLQQVILNLLRNSMEAMEAVDRSNRAITVRAFLRQDGSLTVAIRDTGSGIAAGEAEKVFEPFYTTKTEGTGMGLAISRTIIEAHGGWLSAQANPDGGSTFEFTLPADRNSA